MTTFKCTEKTTNPVKQTEFMYQIITVKSALSNF